MKVLETTALQEFINALQLCLRSVVDDRYKPGYIVEYPHSLKIIFRQHLPDDPGLALFERLVPGRWEHHGHGAIYQVSDVEKISLPLLTNFLMLTRLQPKNIRALAALDAKYLPFAQRLNISAEITAPCEVDSLLAASKAVFTQIAGRHMTLRAVAEAAGLTQVTISKFKAGGDIMLSNFIKIARAVGLRVELNLVEETNKGESQ